VPFLVKIGRTCQFMLEFVALKDSITIACVIPAGGDIQSDGCTMCLFVYSWLELTG